MLRLESKSLEPSRAIGVTKAILPSCSPTSTALPSMKSRRGFSDDGSSLSSVSGGVAKLLRQVKQGSGHSSEDSSTFVESEVCLDFSKLGSPGRESEIQTLLDCYHNVRCPDQSRQLVVIKGVSGSGKSTLASCLKKQVVEDGDSYFVAGKYTFTQQDEPYAAFVQVCRTVCQDIASMDDSHSVASYTTEFTTSSNNWCGDPAKVAARLQEVLGSQFTILSRVVPAIKYILKKANASDSGVDDDHVSLRLDERNQLHMAFRKFFRVLGEFQKRFVVVLDDLQWADHASIDLLSYLVRDRENKNLLIVGCYRDDEVSDSHPLAATLNGLGSLPNEEMMLTTISVGNLTPTAINEIVQTLFDLDNDDETVPLAEVVHARTLGNAFFALQFLKSLVDDGMVYIGQNDSNVLWDLEKIKFMTTATSNALELMSAKLEKLPDDVKQMVRLASTLGTVLHLELFSLIVGDFYSNKKAYFTPTNSVKGEPQDEKSPLQIMDAVVAEGLMHRSGKNRFRWEHDKILEAAMLRKSKKAKICKRIGELFVKTLGEIELERHLFTVVRLLNDGSSLIASSDANQRVELATLNLRAGKRSIKNSGFAAAQVYFNKGIELLPANHARVYSSLSLDLYSSAAESEYCNGDVSKMEKHCREIVSRPSLSMRDKRRAYTTLMNGLNSHGRCAETVDLCIEVLKHLGCSVPKHFLLPRVVSGLLLMKRIEKRGICSELDKVPLMTDPDKLWAMDILADLFKYAYLADMPNLVALVVFKSLDWTLSFGRSPKVSMFLAQVGMLASATGDYKVGRSYVEQGIVELKKNPTEKLVCDFAAQTYTLVWHWTNCVDTVKLTEGYIAGVAAGAVENASWNIQHCSMHKLFIGFPLGSLHTDSVQYLHQMKEFNAQKPFDCMSFVVQAIENLSGLSVNTSKLAGATMDEAVQEKDYTKSSNGLCLSVMRLFQFFVAFTFDDFGSIILIRSTNTQEQVEKTLPGLFGICVMNYCNAVASISMFRETGQRKYLRLGKKLTKKIQSWVEAGNPNVKHYWLLLRAEIADANGDHDQASELFLQAISEAEGCKQVHDCAKFEQRYAEFLSRRGNSNESESHMRKAIGLFDEWGALAVSKQLQSKHGFEHLDVPVQDLVFRREVICVEEL